MSQAISLGNLSYSISGIDILRTLNLEIPEQSYFAIAGINGAGKSTLIKLVLDLIRPSAGSDIKIFGQHNRVTGCRNQLAYLPEKFDVKKGVSGWQYLGFVSSIYHTSLDRNRTRELAEKLDFPADRLASKIGGQIHHDPERMYKNYGEVFAIWDWLFGSLYIPERYEEFAIGLGQGEDNPHNSLAKAYYVPVLEAWRALRGKFIRSM